VARSTLDRPLLLNSACDCRLHCCCPPALLQTLLDLAQARHPPLPLVVRAVVAAAHPQRCDELLNPAGSKHSSTTSTTYQP
jgi:hypothetical protein